MIIECPSCHVQYNLPGELPPAGRKVRCAKCTSVWIAKAEVTGVAEEGPQGTELEIGMSREAGGQRQVRLDIRAPGSDAADQGSREEEEDAGPSGSPFADGVNSALTELQNNDAAAVNTSHAFWPEESRSRAEPRDRVASAPIMASEAGNAAVASAMAALAALASEKSGDAIEPRFRPLGPPPLGPPLSDGHPRGDANGGARPSKPPPKPGRSSTDLAFGSTKTAEELARQLRWGGPPQTAAPDRSRDAAKKASAAAFSGRGEAGPAPTPWPAPKLTPTGHAAQPEWARAQQAPGNAAQPPSFAHAVNPSDPDAAQLSPSRPGTGAKWASRLGWLVLLGAVSGGGWYGAQNREAVALMLPGSAKLYAALDSPVNVRGLDIRNVSTQWVVEDGRQVVEVAGEISNVTRKAQRIPSLVVALRDEDGLELCSWRTQSALDRLSPGNVTRFSVRIPPPAEKIESASVRFAKSQ